MRQIVTLFLETVAASYRSELPLFSQKVTLQPQTFKAILIMPPRYSLPIAKTCDSLFGRWFQNAIASAAEYRTVLFIYIICSDMSSALQL